MSTTFSPGKFIGTPGALAALHRNDEYASTFFARHLAGDWGLADEWGEVDAHDWQANEQALQNGDRLLSAYLLRDGTKIYIITEGDRSATTILLPLEA